MSADIRKPERFSFRDRSVFVTGGGGFLGSWLVKALVDRGAAVVCLMRDEVPQNNLQMLGVDHLVYKVRGDLCDGALLDRALNEYGVDTVFHLAAQPLVGVARSSPVSTLETNVRGTWLLLDAVRRTRSVTRTVIASSDKAYGVHDQLPYTEDFAMNGQEPYDASKSCADILARTFARAYDLPITVTRCGNLYGGGDLNLNRIVPDTIKALCEGRAPVIRSDGTFVRDYLYVEDAVSAYLTLAERAREKGIAGQAFNFSSGKPAPVIEVVKTLIQIHGGSMEPVILNEARGEIREQHLDSSRAREVLGWTPKHDLNGGLRKAYDWYVRYFADRSGGARGRSVRASPAPLSAAFAISRW